MRVALDPAPGSRLSCNTVVMSILDSGSWSHHRPLEGYARRPGPGDVFDISVVGQVSSATCFLPVDFLLGFSSCLAGFLTLPLNLDLLLVERSIDPLYSCLLRPSLLLTVLMHGERTEDEGTDSPAACRENWCYEGQPAVGLSSARLDAPPRIARTPPMPNPAPIPVRKPSRVQGFLCTSLKSSS